MDHARLRGHHREKHSSDTIELGNEPPLSVDGGTGVMVDRRRVSVQWFSGTILTGVCGTALMGGAVFASLDGETNFASIPERIGSALRGAISVTERAPASRKGDRLPPPSEIETARHLFRVTTTAQIGDREVVRVRPFVRISANLSLSPTKFAGSVPELDTQRLLAAAGADNATVEPRPAVESDAEVSFVMRDLASVLPRAKLAATVPMNEVIARVRETANWTGSGDARYQIAGLQPIARLAYAGDGFKDPYAGFETRIVPENITLLPKTAPQATGGNDWNERSVAIKADDSIASILEGLGAAPGDIKEITAAFGSRGRPDGLKEGDKLRVLLATNEQTKLLQPVRVIVAGDNGIEAAVALSDLGRYVPVDVVVMNSEVAEIRTEEEQESAMRLYNSLYETALRHEVPKPVIEALLQIYSFDSDFQERVKPGDAFDVLYAGDDETNGEARAEVLFAALTLGGETRRFYRFQTPDDGIVDYYDETGKSARQFLVRKPVATGVMRSGFGSRRHPLLGYTRMHTGVDWAAPLGTPIYAAGNGLVERAGWESGYGRYIRIRHANGYETAYAHMTAFARNIKEGVRVRQGQVIGYVGSTGLSTGPHLHYEIIVNGRFVDPLRLRLPRGRSLEGPILANFEKERERIEALLNRAGPRLAQASQTIR